MLVLRFSNVVSADVAVSNDRFSVKGAAGVAVQSAALCKEPLAHVGSPSPDISCVGPAGICNLTETTVGRIIGEAVGLSVGQFYRADNRHRSLCGFWGERRAIHGAVGVYCKVNAIVIRSCAPSHRIGRAEFAAGKCGCSGTETG